MPRARTNTSPWLPQAVAVRIVAGLIITVTAAPAWAAKAPPAAPPLDRTAQPKQPGAASWQTWSAPSGRLSIRLQTRGHELRTVAHAKATPQQLQESLEVILGGDVLLRAEGYANPDQQTARAWLRSLPAPLRAGKVSRLRRLPRGATGVRIRMARSPQTYAQDVLLISTKTLRLRVICPDRDDKRAVALLRAALRGLKLTGAQAPGTKARRHR